MSSKGLVRYQLRYTCLDPNIPGVTTNYIMAEVRRGCRSFNTGNSPGLYLKIRMQHCALDLLCIIRAFPPPVQSTAEM